MIFNQGGGLTPDNVMNYKVIWTPGTAGYSIPSGTYLRTGFEVKGDVDLLPENIKKGVNLFNVAGTYEGAGDYVWKKTVNHEKTYSPSPAVVAHCEGSQARLYDYTFTDMNYIPVEYITAENYVDILDQMWLRTAGYDLKLVKNGSGGLNWNKLSSTDGSYISGGSVTFDAENKILTTVGFTWDGTYNYGQFYKYGTSVTIGTKEFIDYVVSNNLNEYPNGGTVDGYYYELVKENTVINNIGIQAADMGYSNMKYGQFSINSLTLTADYTIVHNLGTVPKLVIIYAEPTYETTNDNGLMGLFYNSQWKSAHGSKGVMLHDSAISHYNTVYDFAEAKDYLNLAENHMVLEYKTMTALKFKAGVKYHYIVAA